MSIVDPTKGSQSLASRRARARWGLAAEPESEARPEAIERPGRLTAFAYVDVEKSPLYRAIMGAFMAGKERFALHMRPEEVRAALVAKGWGRASQEAGELTPEEVEAALKQLRAWGNLRADPDTAEVATVEEFYRERLLYQLTREGEAAERALALFEKHVAQPGELQTAALEDIRALLGELEQLALPSSSTSETSEVGSPNRDAGKVFGTLRQLCARFEELTDRAQTFMRSLRRSIDLHGEGEEVLLRYKERLVDYLERFLQRLLVAGEDIADTLRRIEAIGIDEILELAAGHEVADRLDGGPEVLAGAWEGWRLRWSGLRRWFIGEPGERSQAEVLRASARSAIPALLQAISALHDRRVSRSDRFSDLRALARWFAEAPSDRQAHRLWRIAFGLSSSRHLRIDDDTLARWDEEQISASVSWLEAPPLELAPRLRATGRYNRRGRPRNVIDRSAERERLATLALEESRQIERARKALASGRRMRLSEIGALDPAPFALLLELLGEALSRQGKPDETVTTSSIDGAIEVVLEPIAGGREGAGERTSEAVIETAAGRLRGRDFWVTFIDRLTQAGDDSRVDASSGRAGA